MSINIFNLCFPPREYFDPFTIDRYTFTSTSKPSFSSTYNPRSDWRDVRLTAAVSITDEQEPSIIYNGGKLINRLQQTETELTFLDDVLLLMSLCLARNVCPEYLSSTNEWPVIARNHLEQVSATPEQLSSDISAAISCIRSVTWQQKYLSGFHLRMICHAANVLNKETRFLALFVLWEWLYGRLTGDEKENNLRKIMAYILKHFWPDTNSSIFNDQANNIMQTLRNQLAHSGLLPINRGDFWMRAVSTQDLLGKYILFFTHLTQIIVLKTIGLNCESRIPGFSPQLKAFLSTGELLAF